MICVYPADCTDFSNNGNGILNPKSCVVSETLNGEWELELVHPLDEEGKWTRLVEGCILRAPVPAAMTPSIDFNYRETTTTTTSVVFYKIQTTSGKLNLRNGPGMNYKVLTRYAKGVEVVVLNSSNSSWYEVSCPDGKHGWMSTDFLVYSRTETTTHTAYGDKIREVVESRQLRDQPFRIYRVVPELKQVTVYARHVFYDLMDNMVRKIEPASSAAGASVVRSVSEGCLSQHGFTFYSNLQTTAAGVSLINKNPVEALLGEGGVAEMYGGELARDWWDVFVVDRVGSDSGVQIREGKNLTGISYDLNLTDVVTRIMPTGTDKDGNILYLPEVYVDSENIDAYPHPKWVHLDVAEAKEVTTGYSTKTKSQCYSEMRAAAQDRFAAGCDLPTVSLSVDFVSVKDSEEYRDYTFLQDIFLGDTVRVIAPRIGVAVSLRMTRYKYDCLLKRYTSMILGSVTEALEGNTISARQLPSGIINGSKLATNSVGQGALQGNSVGNVQIQAAAIDTAHIRDASISTAKIADASITAAKIADAQIDSAKIADASITRAKIADAAIGTAQIEDGSIVTAHIGAGEIQTANIAEAAVTTAKITDGAITNAKIGSAAVDTANITDAAITNAKIGGAAVGTANIQDAAIASAKILDGSVTKAKIADLAVDAAQINNLAVTTAKIANGAITNAKIGNAAVNTAQIALGAITQALIAQGAVGTAQIEDASITDAKIVSLNADVITSGTLATERLIIRGDDGLIYEINAKAGGLTSQQLSDTKYRNALSGTVLVARSVTAEQIAAATITANEILAGSITGDRIAANTIEGANIKAGTITTAKVSSDFGKTLDLSSNTGIGLRVESAVQNAVSGMELGGRNYVLSADVENASSEYNIHQYHLSTPMTAGEKYTLTVCCTPAAGVESIRPYVSGGYSCLCIMNVSDMGRQILKGTFTAQYYAGRTPEDDESNADIAFFRFPNDGTVTDESVIHWVQLEKGDTATDFRPAPEDDEESLQLRLAEIHSQISAEAESIRQEVQANYVSSADLGSLSSQVSSLSEQSENNFTWSVTQINQLRGDMETAQEATAEQLQLLQTYMSFDNAGLIIGKTGNPFTFRVINDRLSFYMNETEVAYLSNNKLYVTQAEILTRLQIGKFAFEPQTNGNMSLIYIG